MMVYITLLHETGHHMDWLDRRNNFRENKNYIIIGSIHTPPPNNKGNEWVKLNGGSVVKVEKHKSPPYDSESSDANFSYSYKIPVYQIDPAYGGVFLQRKTNVRSRFLDSEEKLYNEEINLTTMSLNELQNIRNED